MQVRTAEETKENVGKFTQALAVELKKKKVIDTAIKDLKQYWKEEGVAVGKVAKMFNKAKAQAKQSESDLFEEEVIAEWIEADTELQNDIAELNSTD